MVHDVVFDMDAIVAALCQGEMHCKHLVARVYAQKLRGYIPKIIGASKMHHNFWMIHSGATPQQRQYWADKIKATDVVVLKTPASECFKRICKSRGDKRGEKMWPVITEWWTEYRESSLDTVVA